MSNTKRRGLTTEGLLRGLSAARLGARVLYICCHTPSARRAHGKAVDLAHDATPHPYKLRIDFRSGGRLSFSSVEMAIAEVDPIARILLDHAALARADHWTQADWADLAQRRGLA